jgi:hypothetical protein
MNKQIPRKWGADSKVSNAVSELIIRFGQQPNEAPRSKLRGIKRNYGVANPSSL